MLRGECELQVIWDEREMPCVWWKLILGEIFQKYTSPSSQSEKKGNESK